MYAKELFLILFITTVPPTPTAPAPEAVPLMIFVCVYLSLSCL